MYLYDVVKHLERRKTERGLRYRIVAPLADPAVNKVEARLRVVFPFQVREFYRQYGGIQIDTPPLEILPIDSIAFFTSKQLHFATVDGEHRLCFDISHLNMAGQWDIRTGATDALVTLTMASFWSNKLSAWVDKKRPIWLPGAVGETGTYMRHNDERSRYAGLSTFPLVSKADSKACHTSSGDGGR